MPHHRGIWTGSRREILVTAATIPFRHDTIQIGSVTEVSGYRVVCELMGPPSSMDGTLQHTTAQIGTLVKITTPTTFAFGFVDRIAFEPSSAGDARRSVRTEIDLLGEVERMGEATSGAFVRGIRINPGLGAPAFIASDDDMALIYGKPTIPTLAVGTL